MSEQPTREFSYTIVERASGGLWTYRVRVYWRHYKHAETNTLTRWGARRWARRQGRKVRREIEQQANPRPLFHEDGEL